MRQLGFEDVLVRLTGMRGGAASVVLFDRAWRVLVMEMKAAALRDC